MANYSVLKAAVQAVIKTNGNQEITGANMQSTLISIINSLGTGYQFMGVATPSTSPGTPDYNVFYIGGAGTYANFGTSVTVPPTNIAVFKYNGTWTCEQVTVENGGVFDISAFKAGGGTLATYADLAAALGTGGANVPTSVRKGGMSIKFVQSSDNKYVQYRLMAQSFTTDVTKWSFCSDNVYVENNTCVEIKTDGEGRIIERIKSDGTKEVFAKTEFMDNVKIAENGNLEVCGEASLNKAIANNVNVNKDLTVLGDTHVKNIESENINVNGEVNTPTVALESVESQRYLEVTVDNDGKMVEWIGKDGKKYPSDECSFVSIPKYTKLLDAIRDNCYEPFLLGSQMCQANVSQYNTNLGEHNNFRADLLTKQFNYIGLNKKMPDTKQSKIQTIEIGGNQATILNFGNYIYAKTSVANTVYRVPFTTLELVTDSNTTIDAISINCGSNRDLSMVFETGDGNLLVEAINTDTSSDDYSVRYLYKATINSDLTTTLNFLFKCAKNNLDHGTQVSVREYWSISQHGNKILITPYGTGRNGQVWWSEDYGDSFNCIFNIANDTTYVSTKPNGQGGYGAYGIHPVPSQMIPSQGDGFWDGASDLSNGNKHIHGGCYDEEFERIWLVTGDDKKFATGIYWSDDFGKTWHRKSLIFINPDIDMGNQTQMDTVVSLANCVLFGTDGWGDGIFRYNRNQKDDGVPMEYVFGYSTIDHGVFDILSGYKMVTKEGIALMVFYPDQSQGVFDKPGCVVASDGYHFSKVLIDTYMDGEHQESIKIGGTSIINAINDNLYVRTYGKDEILFVENYSIN